MKIYKKQVKKHEEVWMYDDSEYCLGDCRVRVCIGNSNYGRLYVADDEQGHFLTEEQTEEAMKLFKEIWDKNIDNHPFDF